MATHQFSNDTEIEDVNLGMDLVSFENVSQTYCQLKDLIATYVLRTEVIPSSRDWVGLFPTGWGTTDDYLTYVWAPQLPKGTDRPQKRAVVFFASQLQAIPSENRQFQFLFVASGNHVRGVSEAFGLVLYTSLSQNSSSTSSWISIFENPSFTLVDASSSMELQGLFNEPADEETELLQKTGSANLCTKDEIQGKSDKDNVASNSECEVIQGPVPGKFIAASRKPRTVTEDHTSLVDGVTEFPSFAEKLRFVSQHPILREYIGNKERAVVPFIPIYRLENTEYEKMPSAISIKSKTNGKRQSAAFQLANYVNQSSSWIQLELMTNCCALCSTARSLLGVYRRQLAISSETGREFKEEVKYLHECLEDKNEEIAILSSTTYKDIKNAQNEAQQDLQEELSGLRLQINLLQEKNTNLETERQQLIKDWEEAAKNLADLEEQYHGAESQLNDLLFSLSLKGYTNLVDFNGTRINLSEVDGEPLELEGWQMNKNKRCGRLLAIINQQEKHINQQQQLLSEKDEHEQNLVQDREQTQRLLKTEEEKVCESQTVIKGLKDTLNWSLQREESYLERLANAEDNLFQAKLKSESRELNLMVQIQELKNDQEKKSTSTMKSFTNRLLATGQSSAAACKTTWCANLCPTYRKSSSEDQSLKGTPVTPSVGPCTTCVPVEETGNSSDQISWENEEGAVMKQPKTTAPSQRGGKKARKHSERKGKASGKSKGPQQKRAAFPENCPTCGISFSSAIDYRVIDEHLAFHDIYRV